MRDRRTPILQGLIKWEPGLGPYGPELHLLPSKCFSISTDHPGKTENSLRGMIQKTELFEVIS